MIRTFRYALCLATVGLIGAWCVDSGAQDANPSTGNRGTPTLDSLKLQFDIDRAELLKPLRDLDVRYEEQLNQLMTQVTKAGNLQQALAVKAELENYRTGNASPGGDEFLELKRLQEVYSAAKRQRTEAMNQQFAPAIDAHHRRLLALQTQLTKEGILDEALRVRAEVDETVQLIESLANASGNESPLFAVASKNQPHENSLGMKFVPVPIIGGATAGKKLLFSVWETRVADYDAFIKQSKRAWPKAGFKQTDMHPAVMVPLDEAREFCKWLTEKERDEGKIGSRDRYRLPTDHEWSCAIGIGGEEDPDATPAAKSGQIKNVYPWGDAWPPPPNSGNFCGEETTRNPIAGVAPIPGYSDSFERTSPVGSFPANQFGLYDLSGNVTELVEDWFKPDFPVMRGTCFKWRTQGRFVSSFRIGCPRKAPGVAIGFRCVLEPGT